MVLSIIIPTYNRKNLVKYTLDSVKQERHPGVDLEVIVVDDNSQDGTLDFIEQNYPDVIRLTNQGKGASSARNEGLKTAKGKYILYLDSDDLAGDNYFLKKLQFLELHADTNACYGEFESFESKGEFTTESIIFKIKYPLIVSADKIMEHLGNYAGGYYMPQNAIIWRKAFLEKIGGHDPRLSINQDVELFTRALLNNLKIIAIKDNTCVYVRSHSLDARAGSAGNSEAKYREILELRKSIISEIRRKNIHEESVWQSLSLYLFYRWKELRSSYPDTANDFLVLAKDTYWPVQLPGGKSLRLLSKIIGPVNAVKVKALFSR